MKISVFFSPVIKVSWKGQDQGISVDLLQGSPRLLQHRAGGCYGVRAGHTGPAGHRLEPGNAEEGLPVSLMEEVAWSGRAGLTSV